MSNFTEKFGISWVIWYCCNIRHSIVVLEFFKRKQWDQIQVMWTPGLPKRVHSNHHCPYIHLSLYPTICSSVHPSLDISETAHYFGLIYYLKLGYHKGDTAWFLKKNIVLEKRGEIWGIFFTDFQRLHKQVIKKWLEFLQIRTKDKPWSFMNILWLELKMYFWPISIKRTKI